MPAAQSFTKTRDALRSARARLTEMNVQEVSMVDNAANLRKWVVTKRDEIMAKSVLPPTAKQSMLDGLAQALDKMSSLATVISEAEVAEGAPVPPELAKAIAQCGELLHGMAKQFLPTTDGDTAEKALPSAQKESIAVSSKQKQSLDLGSKQKKDADESGEEVEKAGKKMSGARYAKLVDARSAAADHLASLDALIADVGETPAASAETSAAKAGKPPWLKPGGSKDDAADGEDDEEDMPPKKGKKASKDVTGEAVETLTAKVAELTAKLEKVTKAAPAPAEAVEGNARALEGEAVAKSAFKWPADLSAAYQAKKAAARAATRAR